MHDPFFRPEEGPVDPDPPAREDVQPTRDQVAEEICRDILAIHHDSYGRGADGVQAHVLDDTVIVLLDGIELLPNEEFMIRNGRVDAVVDLRSQFQKAIEPTFRAAVERATGRRVVGFASQANFDGERPFALEVFRLHPG
jgi:uncharacterized protein YbcI